MLTRRDGRSRAALLALLALLPPSAADAAAGDAPALVGASLRRVHAAAGVYELPLSLDAASPTTEPRAGPSHTLVLTFDKPVAAGVAVVTEGAATAGDPTFAGNEMRVALGSVADRQYVAVAASRVIATDGGAGGRAAVRVGFLAGDVSQNRVVTLSDVEQVNASVGQPIAASNYLRDVDASGTLTAADLSAVNAQLTMALPAVPTTFNQPPTVSAGAAQAVVLPGPVSLAGSATDDGRPGPLSVTWSKISGPGTVVFANPGSAVTTATLSSRGKYVLRLVADDGALVNASDVTIDASGAGEARMVATVNVPGGPLVPAFEIDSLWVGASMAGRVDQTGGVARFDDAAIRAPESAFAPALLARLATGTPVNDVRVDVYLGQSTTLLAQWRFTGVLVSGFDAGAGPPNDWQASVRIGLRYDRIDYTVHNSSGGPTQFSWNVKENRFP